MTGVSQGPASHRGEPPEPFDYESIPAGYYDEAFRRGRGVSDIRKVWLRDFRARADDAGDPDDRPEPHRPGHLGAGGPGSGCA